MESREGNWQEFELWLQELRDRRYRRGFYFRGQTDSEWRLKTTLERSGHPTMPIADYYGLIVRNRKIGPAVSAFSSMQAPAFDKNVWNELSDYERYKVAILDQTAFPGGEHLEYAAYLRHHGFPSPILDWSESPYVAAFFAFRDAAPKIEKRAIFAYCDSPQGTWNWLVGEHVPRTVERRTHDIPALWACSNSPQALLSAIALHSVCKQN